MKNQLKEDIQTLLEPALATTGVEIVELVLSQYKSSTTLRLFVYSENGTGLDECARISRFIGDLIEDTDYFSNGYNLEVSSPGLDRPLTELRDFKFRVGEKVRIEFVEKKRKKQTAEIIGTTPEAVMFKDGNGEFSIPISEIERGKIQF